MGKFSEPISECPSSNMIFLGMCDKKVNSMCSELCNGDETALYTSFDKANESCNSSFENESGIGYSKNNSKSSDSVPDILVNDVCGKKENGCKETCADLSSSCPVGSNEGLDKSFEPNNDLCTSTRVLDSPGESLNGSSQVEHYVNPSMNTTSSSTLVDEIPIELDSSSSSSARLSKVLENISLPLLYIPTTKRLVTGKLEGTKDDISLSKESSSSGDELSKLAGQLSPMSFNSSIGESPNANSTLIPKAHSTGEFDLPGRLGDLDHITVHSVDSLPCSSHLFEPSSSTFCDNCSLSSVSTNTDFSISALSMAGEEAHPAEHQSLSHVGPDDGLFTEINLHTHNSFDLGGPHISSSMDNGSVHHTDSEDSQAAKKKPQVFSGLKSLFSKKPKEESPPGWKLFGKVPPKATQQRDPQEITSEFQARQKKATSVAKPSGPGKRHDTEVMSTTALILENRPMNLPSKTREEAEKHRQQYEEMIEAAKKKEQKDMKMKKKQLQQQRKVEDKVMSAAQMWNTEILPNWESMRSSKKARGLWWMGLPPNIRGRVWQLAIGNDLNVTHELYEICHERAVDRIKLMQAESSSDVGPPQMSCSSITSNKESSVKVIKLDVSRTFPQLCIFQKGGPYFELLHSLLGAYACYRPDVGYVQGMSFIAAILLLNMDVADAFVCFANLLNRPCQMAFFRMDEHMMTSYYSAFEEFFKENLPRLFDHFKSYSVTPNLYLMEWVFLLYSKSLPLDVACRVWDVFCRDGEEFLFRTAIGILKLYEGVLLQMDFIHMAQYLTKLPEDICADQLFKMVETVGMSLDKKGFNSVHSYYRDNTEVSSHAS